MRHGVLGGAGAGAPCCTGVPSASCADLQTRSMDLKRACAALCVGTKTTRGLSFEAQRLLHSQVVGVWYSPAQGRFCWGWARAPLPCHPCLQRPAHWRRLLLVLAQPALPARRAPCCGCRWRLATPLRRWARCHHHPARVRPRPSRHHRRRHSRHPQRRSRRPLQQPSPGLLIHGPSFCQRCRSRLRESTNQMPNRSKSWRHHLVRRRPAWACL